MKKVILSTGISSGFGKETAALLAERGHVVYGTVRKDTVPIANVNVLHLDLTDEHSIKTAVEYIAQKEGKIDVLINNAGMHVGGPVETTPFEYARKQIGTNFLGTAQLTQTVLPVMRSQGGGTIINFSSIGGLMGLPFQPYYSASKFAVEGFTESLRMEVKQFNIKVVVVNPGDFHTGNTSNRRNYLAPTNKDDPYNEQYAKTLQKIENDEIKGWDPKVMAKHIVRIAESKKPSQRYIIGPFEQKLSVFIKKIIPGSWFRKIIEDYYKIK